MKKLFLALVIISLPLQFLFAQMPVVASMDAFWSTLTVATKADQAIAYAQQLNEYVQTAMRFEAQIQKWAEDAERYAKALGSFKDISDFSSFMDWYNRALYEEQNFNESIMGANITIGKKSYSWYELDQIGADLQEDLKWDEEFTEEQRYEMWMNLGLTPANYAYVAPYRQKAAALTYEMMAQRNWQDKWAARTLESSFKRQQALEKDKLAKLADKLTDKELLMMITEALNEQNVTLSDLAKMQSMALEDIAIQRKLQNAPKPPPKRAFSQTPRGIWEPLN